MKLFINQARQNLPVIVARKYKNGLTVFMRENTAYDNR